MTAPIDEPGQGDDITPDWARPEPARPAAAPAGTARPTTRRAVTRRAPVARGTLAVGGAGVVGTAVVAAGVLIGWPAAAVAAAAIPVVIGARLAARSGKARSRTGARRQAASAATRTTTRRVSGGGAIPRLGGGGRSGLGLPKLGGGRSGGRSGAGMPKLGGRTAGRAGAGAPKPGGTGRSSRSGGTGVPKLPGVGKKAGAGRAAGTGRATSGARVPGLGGKPTGRSGIPGVGGRRNPAGRGGSGRTGLGRVGMGPAGARRAAARQAGRVPAWMQTRGGSSGATPGTGRSRRNTGTGRATTANAMPAIRGRMPRTHLGRVLKAKRHFDQNEALKWWGGRRNATKATAATAARKARQAAGNVGAATATGFRTGTAPRHAARAAWVAAKANRSGARQKLAGLPVAAAGAVGAFAARAGTNSARRVHRHTTAPLLVQARSVRRRAVRATRGAGKRMWWTMSGNREQLAAANARSARRHQIRQDLYARRKAARKAKYAVTPIPVVSAATSAVPVVAPATTQPRPAAPAAPSTPAPTQTPAPATAAAGGHAPTGGTTMTGAFPPQDAAANLQNALLKYSPGNGSGALFAFYESLNTKVGMAATSHNIAFGWTHMFKGVLEDLGENLHAPHRQKIDEVTKLYWSADQVVQSVHGTFAKIHARELQRRETRGSQVTNVSDRVTGQVTTVFEPFQHSLVFAQATSRWRVGVVSGALFHYGHALPGMAAASWWIANGWGQMAVNVQQDLQGGINPAMIGSLQLVFDTYRVAADGVKELSVDFRRMHAADLERQQRPGAHTADVVRSR